MTKKCLVFVLEHTSDTRGHQRPTLVVTQSLGSSALVPGVLGNSPFLTQSHVWEWTPSRSAASITLDLPKHRRGSLLIYGAAVLMFGLEPEDELVTKDKHRLHSTLTRSARFEEIVREQELQINHGADSASFRFEVTFCQTVDPMVETGLVSSINMVWLARWKKSTDPPITTPHIISFSLTKKLCSEEFRAQTFLTACFSARGMLIMWRCCTSYNTDNTHREVRNQHTVNESEKVKLRDQVRHTSHTQLLC